MRQAAAFRILAAMAAAAIAAAAIPATAMTAMAMTATARADETPAARELTALVNDFLAGVSRNDGAVHERFWAEDLVYTRAAGQRIGKADILRDARGAAPKPGDPPVSYAAEDVRVRQYGDAAVVAFRLVATTGAGSAATVDRYLNTGTFVKRAGRWQAVAWQATRIPVPVSDANADAAAASPAPESSRSVATSPAPESSRSVATSPAPEPARSVAASPAPAPARSPAASPAPSPASGPNPAGGGMGQVFLVLLQKGPAWTAERTDATRALQEAHMANIKTMWEEKKLIIAGPDGDDHDMRGVFVFAAKDRAEAQAFAESDPAVKAGRLVPEIHSWWVERNALPEPGAYCR